MAPRRIVVRKASPGESSGRWQKARQHTEAMDLVLKESLYDSATLPAIYAAIAACDAFTLHYRSERSTPVRHLDAVHVFARVTMIGGVKEAARHLENLLEEKAWIEYSDRSPRPEEAQRLCEHARRFVEFVGRNLA
jgi:hypothetical protein